MTMLTTPPTTPTLDMERRAVGSTLEVWPSKDEDVLFNEDLLKEIDCSDLSVFQKHGLSYTDPGEGLRVRPLSRGDYDKGYLLLLSQLTRVGDVSRERYEAQFSSMKLCPGAHYILVIEDLAEEKVVCTGSLAVERKFIHTAALRGRLEDVVVDADYRGRHLGELMVGLITELSRHIGCYKISLDCVPRVQEFYQKSGYIHSAPVFMFKRFYD